MEKVIKNAFATGLILVIFCGLGAAAKWLVNNPEPIKNQITGQTAIAEPDSMLVQKFLKITSFLSNTNHLALNISIFDGADSTQNIIDLPYRFEQQGARFYCQFGKTETLIANEKYLFVDHGQQKMMFGNSSKNKQDRLLPIPEKVVDHIKSEGYVLKDETVEEGIRKISLINMNHISCRVYEVTYQAQNLEPLSVFLRMDNFNDPYDIKLDKRITFKIKRQNPGSAGIPDMNSFLEGIKTSDPVTTKEFSKYELIKLP
ncbi:hypothetical protein DU508_16530 [Pedobacter chinensis]|uniref:Uncharacterized protein n=1 Tax=Pedobacter chinensis TaxID=2282421 RepID=A0A369PXD3_9SPHI|nr:hypothetical protein [Pedobacter chinensis]RDC55865.1 hypothetical protein DU508_16530 [Pedobacter chinensis]